MGIHGDREACIGLRAYRAYRDLSSRVGTLFSFLSHYHTIVPLK